MYKSRKEQIEEIEIRIKELGATLSMGQSMLDKESDPLLKEILCAALTKGREQLTEFKKRLMRAKGQ